MSALQVALECVKRSKAEKVFEHDVVVYGSIANCLRALDCRSREEAVAMLAKVQSVRIYKIHGKVVIE